MKKRGQVTLFILLAIVIVSIVIVYFIWFSPSAIFGGTQRLGFEGCVSDALEQKIDELGKTAGFINPEFSYSYKDEKVPYLCYTNEPYITCTVQKPFLKQFFEENVEKLLRPSIDSCYENSLNELSDQGYDVKSGVVTYKVIFELGKARVELDAPTTVGSGRVSKFRAEIVSPIYEMIMLSTSIIQSEAKYGDASTDPYRLLYPDYVVDKLKQGEGTTIYIIESKIYGDKLQFASRSLIWPAGFDK